MVQNKHNLDSVVECGGIETIVGMMRMHPASDKVTIFCERRGILGFQGFRFWVSGFLGFRFVRCIRDFLSV
jgi:hypothetical protein